MIRVRAPLKVVWCGEHMVPAVGGIVSAIDRYVEVCAEYDETLEDLVLEHTALLECPFPADLCPLKYRVRLTCDEPLGVGLGTSSAILTCVVALTDVWRGNVPLDRTSLFERVRVYEEERSGASGIDAVACVYGGTHYYHPDAPTPVPLAHFPRTCTVTKTGIQHAASCAERVTHIERMRGIVEAAREPGCQLGILIDEAHAVLRANGLSCPEVEEVIQRQGGGKVTGRGRGGCVLSLGTDTRIVDEGVRVVHSTLDVPPYLRTRVKLSVGDEATATAHPNIALTKYWSKSLDERQMASNASVSLTLPHFVTTTTLRVVNGPEAGEWVDERVRRFLQEMIEVPEGCRVAVHSESNFPPACGIASSASGFAALVRAAAKLLGGRDANWQQQWARLGSGSAVRSIPEGSLVSWTGRTAQAHPDELHLEHALVVFDPMPKRVSSSDGHARARTSMFHDVRCALTHTATADVISAFARGDFAAVRAITEYDALAMHTVAATSSPPLHYVHDWSFVDAFVRFRTERRLEAMYTIDAGANVHLLFTRTARDAVLGWVATRKHMFTLFEGVKRPRYECVVLSGKRYSGKTTLATKLAEEHDVQVVDLSAALKRAYCATHGVSYEDLIENRALKETHRAAMIEFGEAARADDPYVWCRAAWESLAPYPLRVVVSDARRPADLTFWTTCTKCTTVRIECSSQERVRRGWTYDPKVDNAVSETGLDAAAFDVVLNEQDTFTWPTTP